MKNLCYLIAATFALACTVLPVSLNPMWLQRYPLLIPALGLVCFVALVIQAILQWREDKRRDRLERERDERDKIVQHTLERLSGSLTARDRPSPLTDLSIHNEDPCIYVEFDFDRRDVFAGFPFILCNRGGSVAHRVQVAPLKMTTGSAEFEEVDTISSGKYKSLVPDLKRAGQSLGVLQARDIRNVLLTEWDAAGEISVEFVRPMNITYRDVNDAAFETSFDLVFLPISYITDKGKQRETLKTRNLTIRRIGELKRSSQ